MIQRAESGDLDLDVFRTGAEFQRIMNQSVHEAQQQAREAGVPLVYSINGILHWELPDGSLTTEDPWESKGVAKEG